MTETAVKPPSRPPTRGIRHRHLLDCNLPGLESSLSPSRPQSERRQLAWCCSRERAPVRFCLSEAAGSAASSEAVVLDNPAVESSHNSNSSVAFASRLWQLFAATVRIRTPSVTAFGRSTDPPLRMTKAVPQARRRHPLPRLAVQSTEGDGRRRSECLTPSVDLRNPTDRASEARRLLHSAWPRTERLENVACESVTVDAVTRQAVSDGSLVAKRAALPAIVALRCKRAACTI